MGRPVSRISCMHFAKQMEALGEYRALCGKGMSAYQTLMWAGALPRPVYFKQDIDWEESYLYFVILFSPYQSVLLVQMRFTGTSNIDNFICCFVFSIHSSFLPIILPSLWYFRDDRWRLCFKQSTQKNGYNFAFSFHVYFRNYFRGVSKSCISLL